MNLTALNYEFFSDLLTAKTYVKEYVEKIADELGDDTFIDNYIPSTKHRIVKVFKDNKRYNVYDQNQTILHRETKLQGKEFLVQLLSEQSFFSPLFQFFL